MKEILLQKLKAKQTNVAVLGLGYVGLPLAVVFAEAGFRVVGIDPDVRKVETVNRGESHIQDVPSSKINQLVSTGFLKATTDFAFLAEADAVSVCVPTPLNKTGDPDMSFILNATEQLSHFMHKGMVIVLESTTYPGTTREIMLPMITKGNDLKVGTDFYLAFSPERVDPGREDWTTYNTPKVIGGVTADCTELAAAWYGQAIQTVVSVSSAEAAEMAKLLENTFRMINIGLVNEMAIMCSRLGIDVWEVIEAAATKPFGYMKFSPGPGVGGHCIPIDPLYLSWKLKALNYTARFIELASEINTNMPRYVISLVQDALNQHSKPIKGSRCLVLGAAYKPNIDDVRESPALDVIGLLQQKGAIVSYHDPYIPKIHHHDGWELESVVDLISAVREADCIVITTNHKVYNYTAILEAAKLVVDTRNAMGKLAAGNPKVVRL